jgi:hypothetical protein
MVAEIPEQVESPRLKAAVDRDLDIRSFLRWATGRDDFDFTQVLLK